MANELSETEPVAQAGLARSFAQWENMIRGGLVAIAARGERAEGTDVNRCSSVYRREMLPRQVRPDTAPLGTMIEHLSRLGMR
jgi:TetR/AcrR family transcriptional regulator, transcriptional repressor for nem operon